MSSLIFIRPRLACIKAGLLLGLTVGFSMVQAQTATDLGAPALAASSKTAAAKVPAFEYCSVFSRYQAFNDQSVASWSQTNEQVQKIGGWRAYAKESHQSEGSVSTPAAPSSPNQHDKHGSKP